MKNNLRVGDRIQDRWEIHKILKGGMGIVYFVYDHESREVYAAKTICHEKIENDPSTVLRFIKEANAWINLDAHPNVVEARMVRTIDGKPYIFLELIAGGDLGTWIGTTRLKFNFHQSLTFALQFCDGMSYANSKGIKAHRDIKPSNCLVADDGSLKITDFGIAKAFDNSELEGSSSNAINSWMASQNLVMTQTGSGLGTCAYMSPEQFDDAKNVDTTADIYSFGIMLYQMITGRLPLSGDNWKVYEHAHKFLKPSGMRSQHPKLEAIVLTCLEKSPRNRYLNFGVLRKELADVYQEITGHPAWPPVAGKEMDEIRLLNKGASLEFLGRFPEALTYFNRSLQINPRQSSALYNKGVLALKQEQYEEALAFTDESLAIDPRSFRAWSNKAAILWKLERHKEQYECCNKALAINPNDPRALTLKGIAVNASGQYEAALELYEKALNSAPHFIQALVYRGISLIGLSQFNEAIDSFDLALQQDPTNAQAWTQRATACFCLDKYEECIKSADKALSIDTKYDLALFLKGSSYKSLKNYNEANSWYDRVLALNPKYQAAWFEKGVALLELKVTDLASLCFQAAIELNPNDAEAWMYKSECLLEAHKIEEAIQCIEKAQSISPRNPIPWVKIGIIFGQLGKKKEAIVCFNQAYELGYTDALKMAEQFQN